MSERPVSVDWSPLAPSRALVRHLDPTGQLGMAEEVAAWFTAADGYATLLEPIYASLSDQECVALLRVDLPTELGRHLPDDEVASLMRRAEGGAVSSTRRLLLVLAGLVAVLDDVHDGASVSEPLSS